LFQLVPVTEPVRDLVLSRSPERDLAAAICEGGARSLREDGMAKIAAGLTTPEELVRVLGAVS
jgi:type II secretory ATPase GspE/PulE/Tfp pilus assembly ATPase PilB-like protein